jgi:hypothetical protein
MANFNVATGKIISPSIGPSRTEADFATHIDRTIETDPDAGWIFVADQLDTHVSATLVELIARRCGIELMAQSGRDLVFAPGSPPPEAFELHVAGGPSPPDPCVHRVLQRGAGQAVQA